jgi:hypothetical protein
MHIKYSKKNSFAYFFTALRIPIRRLLEQSTDFFTPAPTKDATVLTPGFLNSLKTIKRESKNWLTIETLLKIVKLLFFKCQQRTALR